MYSSLPLIKRCSAASGDSTFWGLGGDLVSFARVSHGSRSAAAETAESPKLRRDSMAPAWHPWHMRSSLSCKNKHAFPEISPVPRRVGGTSLRVSVIRVGAGVPDDLMFLTG